MKTGTPTSRSAQQAASAEKRARRELLRRRNEAFMAFNASKRNKGQRQLSLLEWQMRISTPDEFKNC